MTIRRIDARPAICKYSSINVAAGWTCFARSSWPSTRVGFDPLSMIQLPASQPPLAGLQSGSHRLAGPVMQQQVAAYRQRANAMPTHQGISATNWSRSSPGLVFRRLDKVLSLDHLLVVRRFSPGAKGAAVGTNTLQRAPFVHPIASIPDRPSVKTDRLLVGPNRAA